LLCYVSVRLVAGSGTIKHKANFYQLQQACFQQRQGQAYQKYCEQF